ncbi:hypothetical protein [Cohnella soli]|uniref:Uncharacterized protein n=1 Tax=Cohnella soli TaxID=425005 RepID=A0ABW0HTE0_9BACL
MTKRPTDRQQRIEWLIRKFGKKKVESWASAKSDQEVEEEFESLFTLCKNLPDMSA